MGEVVHLRQEHLASIIEFLSASPIENVMVLGRLKEQGLPAYGSREFVGFREGDRWQAVAYFSGDISLYAPNPQAIPILARYALKRVPFVPRIVSRKETVDRFWETFREAPFPVLFDRHQLVYTLEPEDFVPQADATIRLARPDEFHQVAEFASAMSLEEIKLDPLREHEAGYLQMVMSRIMNKQYYVLEEDGQLKFQVHLNSVTPYAGQVTGVYTPPGLRGRGYARRGLAGFCEAALKRAPRLCLFVNDFNAPAIHLYERLGFKPVMEYRAIFLKAD